MGLSALDKIRQMYGAAAKEKCPKCGECVTIETTQFFQTKLCEHCFGFSEIEEVEGCCRTPDLHHVQYVVEGGAIHVRQQCRACGWVSGNSVGGLAKEQIAKLPPLEKDKREAFADNKYALKREFLRRVSDKKASIDKEDWFTRYNKYLESRVWREKRDAVLKRDGYLCQACLDALATQVHHRSYEFVDMKGSEPAFDLVAICKPCHLRIETIKAERKKPIL